MAFKWFVIIFIAVIAISYYQVDQLLYKPLPLPKFELNNNWRSSDKSQQKEDKTIKPFKIPAFKEAIADLNAQLNRSLFYTRPLDGINFEYGFNSLALKRVVEYWRDDYLPRWQERLAYLNSFPQFTTEIKGLRIHFIHAKPDPKKIKGKKVLPLLLLHGWPGSVREFYEFIPLLTEPNASSEYVFEVVAPSLVGYGWSEAATRPGFNHVEMAIVMRNLMLRLGYEKFVLQGGDWGAITHNMLSTIFPENVIAYHSNMCILTTPGAYLKSYIASWAPERFVPKNGYHHHFPFGFKIERLIESTGYLYLQATKPDTIGEALVNNPVGLASYILEKFQLVTGPINQEIDALDRVFTLDALLDNLMIYHLSNSATTAARFYAENMSKYTRGLQMERVPSYVQYGCVRFLYDLTPAIDWALKDKFPNLIHSTYYAKGSHFPAFEKPEMLYTDFMQFMKLVKIQ